MRLALIVAVAENGVIGRSGKLPWRLSTDSKYFRKITTGKPVIMGRLTYESIGSPLKGRQNIIVSKTMMSTQDERIQIVNDLESALWTAADVEEVLVIGGYRLYDEALSLADRLYLTIVHAEVDGDTVFPKFDCAEWNEVSRERVEKGEKDDFDMSFLVLDRAEKAA